MRDYAKISPQFWTGPTGREIRKIGGNAQRVALYLMSAPSSSMLGLYYLPLPTLHHEVGISPRDASKTLQGLQGVGFAFYDHATEHVWIPEMAAHQIGETLATKDNRWAGIVKELDKLRKTPFFKRFYERYKTPFNLPEVSPLEAPLESLGREDNTGAGAGTGERAGTRTGAGVGSSNGCPPSEPAPVPEELVKILPMLKRVSLGDDPGTLFGVWRQAYPDVDITKEILKCEAWAVTKKVTRSPSGWAKTLNTWLSKEQDSTKGDRNGKAKNGGRPDNRSPGGGDEERGKELDAITSRVEV